MRQPGTSPRRTTNRQDSNRFRSRPWRPKRSRCGKQNRPERKRHKSFYRFSHATRAKKTQHKFSFNADRKLLFAAQHSGTVSRCVKRRCSNIHTSQLTFSQSKHHARHRGICAIKECSISTVGSINLRKNFCLPVIDRKHQLGLAQRRWSYSGTQLKRQRRLRNNQTTCNTLYSLRA